MANSSIFSSTEGGTVNQLFTIGAEYTRDEIMAIAGNRLRLLDRAAVARFDHDHWVLMLDEDNSWRWKNWLEPDKATMGVNPGKPGLNHMIRFAHDRGESTFMFYRQSGRPRGRLRYLGEVQCFKQSGDFLIFERLSPEALVAGVPG